MISSVVFVVMMSGFTWVTLPVRVAVTKGSIRRYKCAVEDMSTVSRTQTQAVVMER